LWLEAGSKAIWSTVAAPRLARAAISKTVAAAGRARATISSALGRDEEGCLDTKREEGGEGLIGHKGVDKRKRKVKRKRKGAE
jgi:hypothetical protein